MGYLYEKGEGGGRRAGGGRRGQRSLVGDCRYSHLDHTPSLSLLRSLPNLPSFTEPKTGLTQTQTPLWSSPPDPPCSLALTLSRSLSPSLVFFICGSLRKDRHTTPLRNTVLRLWAHAFFFFFLKFVFFLFYLQAAEIYINLKKYIYFHMFRQKNKCFCVCVCGLDGGRWENQVYFVLVFHFLFNIGHYCSVIVCRYPYCFFPSIRLNFLVSGY